MFSCSLSPTLAWSTFAGLQAGVDVSRRALGAAAFGSCCLRQHTQTKDFNFSSPLVLLHPLPPPQHPRRQAAL